MNHRPGSDEHDRRVQTNERPPKDTPSFSRCTSAAGPGRDQVRAGRRERTSGFSLGLLPMTAVVLPGLSSSPLPRQEPMAGATGRLTRGVGGRRCLRPRELQRQRSGNRGGHPAPRSGVPAPKPAPAGRGTDRPRHRPRVGKPADRRHVTHQVPAQPIAAAQPRSRPLPTGEQCWRGAGVPSPPVGLGLVLGNQRGFVPGPLIPLESAVRAASSRSWPP